MKSLRELLIEGNGPSSSHTIGPYKAAKAFLSLLGDKPCDEIDVTLYRSLALTGKGHGTDHIIARALLGYPTKIIFDTTTRTKHPNTLRFDAFYKGRPILWNSYESIGGGAIKEVDKEYSPRDVYPFNKASELNIYMAQRGLSNPYQVIEEYEGKEIFSYGEKLLKDSFNTLELSLNTTGYLPGKLHLKAVAKDIYESAQRESEKENNTLLYLTAYAYAVSEANARGEIIVTAPTCGAAGVVPACLYYLYKNKHYDWSLLVRSYLVGALFCNFIKEMAGISGAMLGCQAEIGSASAFAAASMCYADSLSMYNIEYGAEVALEHFLGLTCDPVGGYVQIPCIERNGMAAVHSYTSYIYAKDIAPSRKNRVSFDDVIAVMRETGQAIPTDFKETSLGGLAKIVKC